MLTICLDGRDVRRAEGHQVKIALQHIFRSATLFLFDQDLLKKVKYTKKMMYCWESPAAVGPAHFDYRSVSFKHRKPFSPCESLTESDMKVRLLNRVFDFLRL